MTCHSPGLLKEKQKKNALNPIPSKVACSTPTAINYVDPAWLVDNLCIHWRQAAWH